VTPEKKLRVPKRINKLAQQFNGTNVSGFEFKSKSQKKVWLGIIGITR